MRPLVVLDTSVFVADAYSRTRRGGASTVLALASAGVIDVVLCEEIRAELREVFEDDRLDPRSIDLIFGRYAELFARARWLTPAPQGPHHLKVVANDEGDTMVVRGGRSDLHPGDRSRPRARQIHRECEHEAFPARDELRRVPVRDGP